MGCMGPVVGKAEMSVAGRCLAERTCLGCKMVSIFEEHEKLPSDKALVSATLNRHSVKLV